MTSRQARGHGGGNKFTKQPRLTQYPQHTMTFTFGPGMDVMERVYSKGLQYEMKCARLMRSDKRTVVATYQLKGTVNATRK